LAAGNQGLDPFRPFFAKWFLSLLSRDAGRLIQAFFAKAPHHQGETGDRNDFAKIRAKSIQPPFSRGLLAK
jgi:hypothetical protein